MSLQRLLRESPIGLACAVLIVAAPAAVAAQDAQEMSVQKLLERGDNDAAVERAASERGNPESTYFAAQALIKTDKSPQADQLFEHLRTTGDASWKAIGESGSALLDGNTAEAQEAATRAIAANGENAYAHYQLGLVASRQTDFERALNAFTRAVELKPDFAYAHYYAGLASQRLRQTPRMSQHFEAFMRLAPSAPERQAVAAILRTLRG
jgi:tetratricopeptide (TPR) repeat protein